MEKFCIYSDTPEKAPCIAICMKKYSYLKDFLHNHPQNYNRPYSVPIKIDCIDIGEKSIHENRCIRCMFCVFGCVGNRILISDDLRPWKMCVDIEAEQIEKLRESFFPRVFKGVFLKLPPVPLSNWRIKYKSFCDFTSVDETENIAVWGANALKYASKSLEPRIALEVGVKIKDKDREGRLDIVLMNLNDNYLFVAETKTTFSDMMANRRRFESQMYSYENALKSECDSSMKRCKFLLIGGEESELLPYNHHDCTSGIAAKQFYDIVLERKLFFISANALLALGLLKMFVSQEKYNLENIYRYIIDDNYVGLLSSGLVKSNGEIVSLE